MTTIYVLLVLLVAMLVTTITILYSLTIYSFSLNNFYPNLMFFIHAIMHFTNCLKKHSLMCCPSPLHFQSPSATVIYPTSPEAVCTPSIILAMESGIQIEGGIWKSDRGWNMASR